VGDHEGGAAFHDLDQGGLDLGLGQRIERAGGLVEDEDRRVLQERARDRQALALARWLDHVPTLVSGLWFVVESQMTRGDVAGVSTNTAELVTLAEQYGLQQRAMGLAYRGWALAYSGMPTEGLELANEAVGLLERSGARMYLSRVYGVIAEIDLGGKRVRRFHAKLNGAAVAISVATAFLQGAHGCRRPGGRHHRSRSSRMNCARKINHG
jgi:hypothetical protein